MAEKNEKTKDVAAAPAEDKGGTKTIKVRSAIPTGADGGNQVALREVDPAHPEGEVFIAGPKPVEAALTPAVKALLRDGILEEV